QVRLVRQDQWRERGQFAGYRVQPVVIRPLGLLDRWDHGLTVPSGLPEAGYSPTGSAVSSRGNGTTCGTATPPGRFSEIQVSIRSHQPYSHCTWASWSAVRG